MKSKENEILNITVKDIFDWVIADIREDDNKKGTIMSMPTGIELNLLDKALQTMGYEILDYGYIDNGKKKERIDIIWTSLPHSVYMKIVSPMKLESLKKRMKNRETIN